MAYGSDSSLVKTFTALPSWINFDSDRGTLIISPMSSLNKGEYSLYGTISIQLPDNAFVGIGSISTPTDSLDLIAELMGKYIDGEKYINKNFKPDTSLLIDSKYSLDELNIRNKLSEFYLSTIAQFRVINSVAVLTHEANPTNNSDRNYLLISTPSTSTITISINLNSSSAKFVSGSFQSSFSISLDNQIVYLSGFKNEIINSLLQLRVDLKDYSSSNGIVRINDGLNPEYSKVVNNISSFFSKNRSPYVFKKIQNQINSIKVTTGSQFNLLISTDTFLDPDDDKLEYSLISSNGDEFPSWIVFKNLDISGIPPDDFSYRLYLKIVASDGYKTAEDEFVLYINASFSFWFQFFLTYGGPFLGLLGIWAYASRIYNIFFKTKYRYPKKFRVKANQTIDDSVIYPIAFIRNHKREAKFLLNSLMKDLGAKQGREITRNIFLYFLLEGNKIIYEKKIKEETKNYLATLSAVELETRLQNFNSSLTNKNKIHELMYHELLFWQLRLPEEHATHHVYKKIKSKWYHYIAIESNSSIESDLSGLPNFTLREKVFEKESMPFINQIDKRNLNIELLKSSLLAYAQKKHNIEVNTYETLIKIKENFQATTITKRYFTELWNTNLDNVRDPIGEKIGHGIEYQFKNEILQFN